MPCGESSDSLHAWLRWCQIIASTIGCYVAIAAIWTSCKGRSWFSKRSDASTTYARLRWSGGREPVPLGTTWTPPIHRKARSEQQITSGTVFCTQVQTIPTMVAAPACMGFPWSRPPLVAACCGVRTSEGTEGSLQREAPPPRRVVGQDMACETWDPYSELGVLPSATVEDIKAAFREKARQSHPDKVSPLAKKLTFLSSILTRKIDW